VDAVKRRKIVNGFILVLSTIAALFGIMWLFWILGTLLYKGFSTLSLQVFIGDPPAPGDNTGGLKHAIVGQTLIVLTASIIGIPFGILAGSTAGSFSEPS